MAAPIPSNLLCISGGLSQNIASAWFLASDGTTPALRVPVATDNIKYQDFPSDLLLGFSAIYGTIPITGTGQITLASGSSVTLVAGGSLQITGVQSGADWQLLGSSPSSRLNWGGSYAENGDRSGDIQSANFSGNLDVENNTSVYDSINVGGDFTTVQGLQSNITNIKIKGKATYGDAGGGSGTVDGVFGGLATTDYPFITANTGPAFTGTFNGGQAVSNVPGYGTLYDQQYVTKQQQAARGIVFDPAYPF